MIPTLTGQSLFDGSDMTIAPTGKPQAIVFLAHWCPHCQAEVPRIVALAKAGKLDGIDVVGVATGRRTDSPELSAVLLARRRSVAVSRRWPTARPPPPQRRTG